MPKLIVAVLVVLSVLPVTTTQNPLATDITVADIKSFVDTLPRDRVSDRPIRVVDVEGHRFGVSEVFRPKAFPSGSNLHRVGTTETDYILGEAAKLITGGTLKIKRSHRPTSPVSGVSLSVTGRVGASLQVT